MLAMIMMMVFVVVIMMVMMMFVMVVVLFFHIGFHLLDPSSRGGYFIKLKKFGIEDLGERHIAIIAVYDFSFSGLKSAVLNYLNSCEMKGETISVPDVAASFQKAVVDVLVDHSMEALEKNGFKKFAIAGGVASNGTLRKAMEEACAQKGVQFYHPSPILCTDNAAMIASAGYYNYINNKAIVDPKTLVPTSTIAL